jgi:2-phosphoglycerate kinase
MLERVLWIGGAQWAGKTTVAQMLAIRQGLVHYAYDYHDARSHTTKAKAQPERYPHRAAIVSADDAWVEPSPQAMAEAARRSFVERFRMVVEELAALPSDATVVAEGWGLRPELIYPHLSSPRQAIFLIPTADFRLHQLRELARAGTFPRELQVSDPDKAQQNRIARDMLLAEDAVESARRLQLRVVMVDGSRSAEQVALLVEEHFRPHLPTWLY